MRAGVNVVTGFVAAGLTCLVCFFAVPSRAVETRSDDGKASIARLPAADEIVLPQPVSLRLIVESAEPPAYVELLARQVAVLDKDSTATLPEGPPSIATRLPPLMPAAEPDKKEPDTKIEPDKKVEPDKKASDKEQPADVTPPPAQTLKDFIKTAVEKLQAIPAKGAHAAEMAKERAAIAAFYAEHDYASLWLADGKPNAAARAALMQIAHADDDGLDLRVIAAPVFETGDAKLAEAEIALSAQVVAYGRQATGSRVDPAQISALIGAKRMLLEPAAILTVVAAAGDQAGVVMAEFNPPQKAYQALRAKLAELRRVAVPSARVTIPDGPDLKIGMRDPRVSLIRARFGLDAASSPNDVIYDTKVAAAVADFQKANGLPASGILSRRTLAALSGGGVSRLEGEIIANMERWRWMPRDIGTSRIEVNIPEFTVTVIHDGEVVTRNRVVVGKTTTPTPVFSNTMQFLIVNPYWNVPQSIIRKEMLPRLAGDPSYLSRLGYQVTEHNGVMTVRQPPGERNALGRIKFMFPNDYAVYLHDTPSRSLFGAAQRAFSHGCVRVDQPFAFAEAVLGRDNGWSVERVKHLIGGKERYVYLPKPLPIHIEYFTAFVDDTGELQLREDIYGYSAKVRAALGLSS